MAVFDLLKSAYTIGGATAVLVAVLIYAVLVLWRRLQKEHDDRLAQARSDNELLQELIVTLSARDGTGRQRHDSALLDYDDDDENTECTYRRREHVHQRARRLIDSYRPR